jgi:SAM-dependent methyltransferase
LADLVRVEGRWLDVGCGAGDYAARLAERGCDVVVGVDPQLRPPLALGTGAVFAEALSEGLPFPAGTFDGLLLNEVLEHVAYEQRTLQEARRVLKGDGHLVVFSPNRWFPFEGHGATIAGHGIEAPVPVLPWLPARWSARWMRARNYWPHQLRQVIERGGFRVETVGFAYPLFLTYPWLPNGVAGWVRDAVPRLEAMPGVRRFGVSTMIIAHPA